MNDPNLDSGAVAAAADRYLKNLRSAKVAAAQATLDAAQQRLSDAETEASAAADDLLKHEWDGSRKRVLAADEEVVLARSMVAGAETALATAKRRIAPELRKLALAKVSAERQWDGLAARRIAHRARVIAAATEFFDVLRSGGEIHLDALALQQSISDAAEALDPAGSANIRQRYAVPLPGVLDADAIAEACRAHGFSPVDLRSLAHAVVDAAAAQRAALVPPGIPRKVQPLDERLDHQRRVNEANMDKWAREAHENDLASLADQYVPRVTDPQAAE